MTGHAPTPQTAASGDDILIRPFTEADRAFFQQIVTRLQPEESMARRDPDAFAGWFRRLAAGELDQPAGTETFIATDQDDHPLGLLMIQPAKEYFTGAERAYVEALVVAREAEGRGIGRVLMDHAETWARTHGYAEVALDVFATNARAIAFYERASYHHDHIRMVKRL